MQLFSFKSNLRVNFGVAGLCAYDKHKKDSANDKPHVHKFLEHWILLEGHKMYHILGNIFFNQITLPGRVCSQVRRLYPEMAFSWGVGELGLPLWEVLRKQTFLLSKTSKRKKENSIKGKYKNTSYKKKHPPCKFYPSEKFPPKNTRLQDSHELQRLNVNEATSPSEENLQVQTARKEEKGKVLPSNLKKQTKEEEERTDSGDL